MPEPRKRYAVRHGVDSPQQQSTRHDQRVVYLAWMLALIVARGRKGRGLVERVDGEVVVFGGVSANLVASVEARADPDVTA